MLAALERAGGGGEPHDFRLILAVARAADSIRRALEKAETPRLVRRRERLPRFEGLLARARGLFGADGSLRDDASGELLAIRTKLRRRRLELSRKLERLLEQRREFLGDDVIVLRNDRYCLPIVASARSRVPGIVHDRSASGQTIFIEPIEAIDANNDLALLAAEERREVERLLTSFGREVLAVSGDLEDAVSQIAELDALEAKVEFGELSSGRIVEISDDGGWTLVSARHPLLDPLLSPLRRRVLEESREARPVVPLDLELGPNTRLLVVSGPNAGGKTVVLKTAGLFSLLAQSGFPLPAATGTRLPAFTAIRTEIGDAQAILSDRSTFSSSMETLASILEQAGPNTLALLDEIGGATDPEEGSAIAVAMLEEYLVRGGRAIASTHLSAIKNFAASRPDALSAAMEFDAATGRPNYRLHPGLSGRSRALIVAREQKLPDTVLSRAEALLGETWRRRQTLESEAEATLERLRQAERALAAEREHVQREALRLQEERDTLAKERARQLDEGLAAFERARADLERRVKEELAAHRLDASRRAKVSAAAVLAEAERAVAEPTLEEARQRAIEKARDLAVGARARWKGGKTEATLVSLEEDSAWLDVSGKRMRVPRSELEPAEAVMKRLDNRAHRTASGPPKPVSEVTSEVNVIGRRLNEAIGEVEKKLDEALLSGAGRLRIVHGHGTGRLRDGLREHFCHYPGVTSLRAADAREGGNGATIVELA